MHLPLGQPHNVRAADETRLLGLQRDLRYNADRHLTSGQTPEADALAARKQELVAAQHEASCRGLGRRQRRERTRANFERFQQLQQVNHRLAELTADQQRLLHDELISVRNQLEANSVLQNREFSFSLFPAEKLRAFMTNLWR